jgi:hypothetical protein
MFLSSGYALTYEINMDNLPRFLRNLDWLLPFHCIRLMNDSGVPPLSLHLRWL